MPVDTEYLAKALANLQADIATIRRITGANRREPHETAKLSAAWVGLDNQMQELMSHVDKPAKP